MNIFFCINYFGSYIFGFASTTMETSNSARLQFVHFIILNLDLSIDAKDVLNELNWAWFHRITKDIATSTVCMKEKANVLLH